MSLIGRFEQRLERGVEGFFTRLFRSGVHPVEIGKRLLRVMDDGKTVALRRTYVPHVYRITVGPKDFERLGPLESKLIEELEIFIGEAARQSDWSLPDSPQVTFALDQGLSAGEFRVAAEAVSLAEPDQEEEHAPTPPRRRRAPAERNGTPCLVLITDGQEVRTVPVPRRAKIGRQADNDLVITDPGVSRHHAEVTNQNGSCVLRDLGSTNGTLVNGSTVTEHSLRDGDRISVGSSVIEFRRA